MQQLSCKGLTLIELLVTITIIGILAVTSIPLFQKNLQASRIKAAGEELYQALQIARSEALKQHTNVYFILHPATGSWCFGSKLSGTCDCTQTNSCTLQNTSGSNFNSQISFSTNGIASNTLIFNGIRGTTGQNGTLTFTLGDSVITINSRAMGNLSICSTNVGGYTSC